MTTTNVDLSTWRAVQDPLADASVAALEERPRRGMNVLTLVENGAKRGVLAHRAFLEETAAAVSDHDLASHEIGRKMAMRHAPLAFLVLSVSSLIESFAVPKGALVLRRTGRLEKDTLPRIYETSSMVRDMFLPDGLKRGRRGHHAILRVRLLHALVRKHLLKSGFPVDTHGAPINQADMVHTLVLFSHVMMRGMLDLGARVRDDEKESFFQLWKSAGALLGVSPALIPQTQIDERALYAHIRHHDYAPDDGSRSLAHAVLDALTGEPPFFLPKPVLHQISRALIGDDLADAFALSGSPLTQSGMRGLRVVVDGLDRVQRIPGLSWLALAGGHAFVESNRVRVLAGARPADFVMRIVPGARRRADRSVSPTPKT